VLPRLGDLYFDALRQTDVQDWVNEGLKDRYRVDTVRGWFRVLRTMIRDAMQTLDLPRDPTLRIAFPEAEEREEPNALEPEQLARFLAAMQRRYPQHHALTAVLAFTGLRFCHASALKWDDLDEEAAVIRVRRKQIRGRVGNVSRKKQAPRVIPIGPELLELLRAHKKQVHAPRVSRIARGLHALHKAPGVEEGWCFPSEVGTLRTPGGLWKAWRICKTEAGIQGRFTVHGLRRTFNDLTRRAGVDGIVIRSLTGHVTEKMRGHYSTVALEEKRRAVAGVVALIRPANPTDPVGTSEKVGTQVGTDPQNA
jgi:integrase